MLKVKNIKTKPIKPIIYKLCCRYFDYRLQHYNLMFDISHNERVTSCCCVYAGVCFFSNISPIQYRHNIKALNIPPYMVLKCTYRAKHAKISKFAQHGQYMVMFINNMPILSLKLNYHSLK